MRGGVKIEPVAAATVLAPRVPAAGLVAGTERSCAVFRGQAAPEQRQDGRFLGAQAAHMGHLLARPLRSDSSIVPSR